MQLQIVLFQEILNISNNDLSNKTDICQLTLFTPNQLAQSENIDGLKCIENTGFMGSEITIVNSRIEINQRFSIHSETYNKTDSTK